MSDYETPKDESLREDVPVPAEVGREEEAVEEPVVPAPLWIRTVNTVVTVFVWTAVAIFGGFCGFLILGTVICLSSQPATRSARLEMERREAEIERAIAAEEAVSGDRAVASVAHESRAP